MYLKPLFCIILNLGWFWTCQSRVVCRDHNPISLLWDWQGEPGTAGCGLSGPSAGDTNHWLQEALWGQGQQIWGACCPCAPSTLQLQAELGGSTALKFRCLQARHLMMVSGPCQVEILCDCWHSCPSSIYRHCVGEKWVFLAQGCWPSWDLWFRAWWGVALLADRSCSLFSHTAQNPASSVFISCLICGSWEPLSACPPAGKLFGTSSFSI